jgi:hypothetical protein
VYSTAARAGLLVTYQQNGMSLSACPALVVLIAKREEWRIAYDPAGQRFES